MNVLEGNYITKIYGKEDNKVVALDDFSIEIEEGEFIGVMGSSGSGKTTLLNVLSGLDNADSGSIIINGNNIGELNKDELALFKRRNLGFVFQEFKLLDSLSLQENIMLPMILDKREPQSMKLRAKEIMSLFDIYKLKDKYPWNVSGGQQQRAAIARAVINEPAILFADEPTGNLDSKSTRVIMNYISKMNKELGSTILMVTHDPFAASYCDRVIFIEDGKLSIEMMKKGDKKNFLGDIIHALSLSGGAVDEI
ncbi:ABC transporter ATP-binding protein [Vallitalea longa]|nr:ABC transporter ATP-binding protein [Vallitalea longa]